MLKYIGIERHKDKEYGLLKMSLYFQTPDIQHVCAATIRSYNSSPPIYGDLNGQSPA